AAGADAPRGAEVRALAADALRWLRAADAALPGDRRTLAAVARARTLDLDFAGAAETLRSLLAKEGADPGLHHLLAAALRGAGDLEGAAAEEGTCLALDPARADAAALRAGDLAALGRVEEARAAALEGLLRVPTADSLYRALWQVDAPARRWAAAEEALLAVLAKHPDQPTALHYLGHLRISSGRIEDALQAFSRKAALEPGNPAPLLQVARLRVARSDLAGAEEAYGRVLELLGPGDGDLRAEILDGYYAVAAAHGVARRFSEAERLFRRLAALDPASASYRMFLGLSLRRLGRYPEAEAAYREAVDLAVFDGSARNDFGLLYLGWGRPADARREFLRSAEEDPRITAPLENLGLMAVAEGRREEARERFLEAHRRASSFRDEADRLKFRRYLDSLR
ncbi:MAG: tetratricopeptide repeat protein, partial [Planctomycetes bacterium]|nr:tetratricopeptide repeat protein [Planctomycetota bacterium]